MSSSEPFAVTYLRSEGSRPEHESSVARSAARLGAEFRVLDWQPLESAEASEMDPRGKGLVLVGTVTSVAALGGPPAGASVVALSDGGDRTDRLPGSRDWLAAVLHPPFSDEDMEEALRRGAVHARALARLEGLRERVADQGRELRELNRIGVALSAERDVDTLLEMILSKCREITSADAGSLYLVERREGAVPDERDYFADKELAFRLTQNDSVKVPFQEFRMDVSRNSTAGFVALDGKPLRIDDAYAIPEDCEYRFDRRFDQSTGYRTRSLLVIPMGNHRDEIIGVLQLINRKRDSTARLVDERAVERWVVPFDDRSAELASSLASQAAVAIENAKLYQDIQSLFEGFIRASVTAIESRDPTTSGHSERVAKLTVRLAKQVDRDESGSLARIRFTPDQVKEIKYASLLHDFGKIGVRENVLLKGKKLYPHELDSIKSRFRFVRRSLELKYARRKLDLLARKEAREARQAAAVIDAELAARLTMLDGYLKLILEANEPTVLNKDASTMLDEVAGTVIEGLDGESYRLLEDSEASNLRIPKGSLSQEERLEIESHVTHTFEFLSNIPWTRELAHVPKIAGAHHEKLDGTGYPRKIGAVEIPPQSRIMTISDIYDALTARDRPYKKAMPHDRALDILSYEVREGKLDPDLFRVFVEAKVYEAVEQSSAAS